MRIANGNFAYEIKRDLANAGGVQKMALAHANARGEYVNNVVNVAYLV